MSSTTWVAGDLIDESVEVAGLDPGALTHRHLNSITRSLELVFIDLETDGPVAEFRMETRNYLMETGDGSIVLESDVIDVTQASILYSADGIATAKPYPLGRTTREDYQNLAYPTTLGTPSVFWISKADSDLIAPASTPVLTLWPQNGLSGIAYVQITCIRQHSMPANFGAALDIRRNWLPTLSAGLAARLALKWNPAEYDRLNSIYQGYLIKRSAEESREPVRIGYRGFGFGRGRRH